MPKKKPAAKKSRTKKPGRGKSAVKKEIVTKPGRRKSSRAEGTVPSSTADEIRSSEASTLRGDVFRTIEPYRRRRGTGAASAGQSGDVQGLSRNEDLDSESVEELIEEGQTYQADILSGVEAALDPDQGEVQTREVPADDVPLEYLDED